MKGLTVCLVIPSGYCLLSTETDVPVFLLREHGCGAMERAGHKRRARQSLLVSIGSDTGNQDACFSLAVV